MSGIVPPAWLLRLGGLGLADEDEGRATVALLDKGDRYAELVMSGTDRQVKARVAALLVQLSGEESASLALRS